MPRKGDFRQILMDEAHNSAYSIHPGSTKNVYGLKTKILVEWDEGRYCTICRPVRYLSKDQGRTLEASRIVATPTHPGLEMGWDEIGMDFVVGLPRTQKGHDSIWVIVDRLTKAAHFIPVRTNYGGEKLAKLYVENIVKLHGVPSRIVSKRGTQFTSRFWKSLHKAMGTKLDFSSAYHPQTDGQTERVNQIMEDMLRACVLTYGKNWEQSLPYV